MTSARIALGGLGTVLLGSTLSCATPEPRPRPVGATQSVESIRPQLVLPGTRLEVVGAGFVDELFGTSSLALEPDGDLPRFFQAKFVDTEHLELQSDQTVRERFTGAAFDGRAYVLLVTHRGEQRQSFDTRVKLQFADRLEPDFELDPLEGHLSLNDPIAVTGSGILLEGEGETVAVFDGCFHPGGAGACNRVESVRVKVNPDDPFDRSKGSLPFGPAIAGIEPGRFDGQIQFENRHQHSGEVVTGEVFEVSYWIDPVKLDGVGEGASLGQYLTIEGAGFVANEQDVTSSLLLEGSLSLEDGSVETISLEIVPDFLNGRMLRYVVNEEDVLAMHVDPRFESAVFTGTATPVIRYHGEQQAGSPLEVSFEIRSIVQLVYVNFLPSYVEALDSFGLRAVDDQIRKRTLEVLRRDYATLAVEFTTEPPEDWALYTQVDIGGPDINGKGLFGYDNTPGKDVDNQRLFDRIGGVNAETQQNGYDGFGGVFVESFIDAMSMHPPNGVQKELADPLFDEIFDPFRPDVDGIPVSVVDLHTEVAAAADGVECPAATRDAQIGCAIYVLGNLIGNTTSHELGHSFGLAEPYGPENQYHHNSDAPNRLMDAGGARPLAERAEIMGQGPGQFCVREYEYLWSILPGDELDPSPRPPC